MSAESTEADFIAVLLLSKQLMLLAQCEKMGVYVQNCPARSPDSNLNGILLNGMSRD